MQADPIATMASEVSSTQHALGHLSERLAKVGTADRAQLVEMAIKSLASLASREHMHACAHVCVCAVYMQPWLSR